MRRTINTIRYENNSDSFRFVVFARFGFEGGSIFNFYRFLSEAWLIRILVSSAVVSFILFYKVLKMRVE
jgi:hypothetical protein